MPTLKVWGDEYNIRLEGTTSKSLKWQLLDLGNKETIIVLPFEVGMDSINFLVDKFGTSHSKSAVKKVHYVAVGHRDDDVIASLLKLL